MNPDKDNSQEKSKTVEELVENAMASLSIEGIRVPDDEKEILRKIAGCELDADEVADAIVQKVIKQSKIDSQKQTKQKITQGVVWVSQMFVDAGQDIEVVVALKITNGVRAFIITVIDKRRSW